MIGADRTSAIGWATTMLAAAFLPVAVAYAGKLIIDSVVLAIKTGAQADRWHALQMVGVELGLMLIFAVSNLVSGLFRTKMETRVAYHVQSKILDKALELEVAHFEDPATYDRLQNARREANTRPLELFANLVLVGTGVIALVSYGGILIAFQPWAIVLLIAAAIPGFYAETKYSAEAYRLATARAPELRRMMYLEALLTSDAPAKEIKLYALGREMIARFTELFRGVLREQRSLEVRRSTWSFVLSLLSTLTLYGYYAYFVVRTIEGALTLGDLALYMSVFRNGSGAFKNTLKWIGAMRESSLFMGNLFSFLDIPVEPAGTRLAPPTRPAAPVEIELRGVSFQYPGAAKFALENIDLTIRAGEKLAIVGENGAGKSTLIKLLTGLYRPTRGTITLDGVALEDFDRDALRKRFGVVFQDFMRYQFTMKDNVAIGDVEHLGELPRIEAAAAKGGAKEIVERLPRGWDTQLGRYFDDQGVELSMGSWQKVSLSRAFMRDAAVLVLDEPTASLDAEAEHALFLRFKALAEGKTAVLISHRFSTVRMADRIVVLGAGKIEELGTHAELLATKGRYAQLFRLQAAGYVNRREPPA